jgi:tetratricopeptide (TPR) repeat protein
VAVNLNNLAACCQAQGRLDEAEPLYRRALAIKEKLLGNDHPDTALTLHNLAVLCADLGRPGEAESLYCRALTTFTAVLGPDHPHARTCRENRDRLAAAQDQARGGV